MGVVSAVSQASIFKTQHIKGYAQPSLSIIGNFAINQDASSYEVFFDSDNDGDDDRLTVSSNTNSSSLSVTLSINDGNEVYIDTIQNFNSINLNNQTNVKLMDVYLQDLDNDGFMDLWFHTKTAIQDYNFSIDNSFIFKNKQSNEYEVVNSFYTESHENSHTSKGRTLMIFEDINGDGLIDPRFHNLYVHDFPAAQYQLINGGSFQFSVKAESTLAYTKKVVALNYNNDGHQDLISLSYIYFPSLGLNSPNLMNSQQSALWVADGSGGFDATENELPLNTAQNIWVFDVNGDVKDDVLVSYRDANNFDTTELYLSDQSNQYTNHMTMDEVIFDAKGADMDNDGRIDLVLSSGKVSIYKNTNNSEFSKVVELNSVFRNVTNLILDDMDNDGKMDVLGVESFGNIQDIKLANNQGDFSFSDFSTVLSSFNHSFVTTDADLDGVPEIMVSPFSAKFYDPSYILKRNSTGDYHWLASDLSDVKDGIDSFFTYSDFIAEDMDNDGRDDIVAIDIDYSTSPKQHMLKVVMHEQSSAIEYYNNADFFVSKDKKYFIKRPPSFDIADFNNDGLKDIVVSGDGGISIMTQAPNPKVETMYYDPNHNGHGYSLEKIGRDNLYYNAFFSYDDNGEPEWFLQLNKMKSTENGVQIYPINPDILKNDISYLYDFSSSSAYHDNKIERKGFIQNDLLGDDSFIFIFNFALNSQNPAELFQWNTERLISHEQEPLNDFGGMWWAGVDDAGWGISLMSVQRVDRVDMIAVLFFYDGDGNPRWLIGDAQNFIPTQPITIDMNMIQGYGRDQTPLELVKIPAGQITLTLNEASQDIADSGTMSMNVRYPQGAQVEWVRDNIPFTMLSKPKN